MLRRIKKVGYIFVPVLGLCVGSFLLGAYLLDQNSQAVLDVINDMRDVDSELELLTPTPTIKKTDDGEFLSKNSFIMQPTDCFPQEKYDAVEKTCYIECNTNEECDILEKNIQDQANAVGDLFFSGAKDYADNNKTEITPITSYLIRGDKITNKKDAPIKENLKSMQTNTVQHEAVWQLFIKLIPLEYRTNLVKLEIATDGKGGTLAYVNPTDEDPTQWILGIDLADVYQDNKIINKEDFTYSLIHEFGHLLTLNSKQVPPDIVPKAITTKKQENSFYEQRKKACQPQYYTGEGCSTNKSYINLFFKKFWLSIYGQFVEIDALQNDDQYYKALDQFYIKHEDRFLTNYAVTNPGEDLAESWTAFVLKKKPLSSQQIADQKILFFYNYPELVKLRLVIRNRI